MVFKNNLLFKRFESKHCCNMCLNAVIYQARLDDIKDRLTVRPPKWANGNHEPAWDEKDRVIF